jgi:alpha-glucoside transport system substrate-binding protein
LQPQKIGRYEIQSELGRGGMAIVYLAFDPRFERRVAVKVLPREFLFDGGFQARFEREAKAIAALEHYAIVPVYDFGEHEGQPYLVMRYMPGGSLADRVRGGPLPLADTIAIVERVAAALEVAHRRGVIHRDVKPGNVLFDAEGDAYLTDFGIVKLTEATAQLTGSGIVGTPSYMAPEMTRPGGTTPLIDVYALGVTLFQALAGRVPYEADTPMGIALAHVTNPIPDIRDDRPDLPGGVQTVILRALAKDPELRYSSALALADDLRAAARGDLPAPVARSPQPGEDVTIPVGGDTIREELTEPDTGMEEAERPPTRTEPDTGMEDAERRPTLTPEQIEATPPAPASPPAPTSAPARPAPAGRKKGVPAWAWIGGAAALFVAGAAVVFGVLALTGALGGGAPETPSTEPPAQVSGGEPEAAATEPDQQEPTESEPEAAPGEQAATVEVMAGYGGEDAAGFEAVIAAFEEAHPDIDVVYVGTPDGFEPVLTTRVEAGDPPDVALIAQPGLLGYFAEIGAVTPLWDEARGQVEAHYAPSWIDMASVGGDPYGVFYRVDAKGFVWYNRPNFEEMGYPIPGTWDELLELQQVMAGDGHTPWCIGIESGDATGWVGTDWIETMMLRTFPAEVYDAWTATDLPFTSDEVLTAWDLVSTIWRDPALVYGGPDAIPATHFADSPLGLFTDPPGCWFHMQGSFIRYFFPEDVQADLDGRVGVFQMPRVDPDLPPALEVAGDMAVVFADHDRPEVRAFVEFLATPEAVEPWARRGGALFPHRGQDVGWYPTEVERVMVETIQQAEVVRLDASDQMPPACNRAFWEGVTAYAGGASIPDAASSIDAACGH